MFFSFAAYISQVNFYFVDITKLYFTGFIQMRKHSCLYEDVDEEDLHVIRDACVALQRGSKEDIEYLSKFNDL